MTALREITRADSEMLRTWRNLPNVRRYMYTDHIIGPEEHARWFAGVFTDPRRKHWIITCDDADVGLGSLNDIDRRHLHCRFASYIAREDLRGRRVGTVAEFLILRHAFGSLGLRRVSAEVLSFNLPGVKVHTSLGFKQEGVLRQHILKEDGPVDVVCLGLLREEWEAAAPEIERRLREQGLL